MGTKHILVVDDSETSARLLQFLLNDVATIHVARDATSAIALTLQYEMNLIMLDLFLPDMDGCELALAIRAQERSRTIPLIAVTACDEPHARARAFEAGIGAFVLKPVHSVEVRELVQAALQGGDI